MDDQKNLKNLEIRISQFHSFGKPCFESQQQQRQMTTEPSDVPVSVSSDTPVPEEEEEEDLTTIHGLRQFQRQCIRNQITYLTSFCNFDR